MTTELNELDFLRPECQGLNDLNYYFPSDLIRLICTWLKKPRYSNVIGVLKNANPQEQVILFKYCVDNNFCQCRLDMSAVFELNNPEIYWMMESRLGFYYRDEAILIRRWTDLSTFVHMAINHADYFSERDPLRIIVCLSDLNILRHFVVNMGYALESEHIQVCRYISLEKFKFFCDHCGRNEKTRLLLEKITIDPKRRMQFVKYFVESGLFGSCIDQYSFDLDILKYLYCEKGYRFGDAQIAYKVVIETMEDDLVGLVNDSNKEQVIAGTEIIRFIYEKTMMQVPFNVFLNIEETIVCERHHNAIKYLHTITDNDCHFHLERSEAIIISCICNDDAQFLVDEKIFINEQTCTRVINILFEKDDIKTLKLLCDNNMIEFRVIDLENAVPTNQIHHEMMKIIVQFYFGCQVEK